MITFNDTTNFGLTEFMARVSRATRQVFHDLSFTYDGFRDGKHIYRFTNDRTDKTFRIGFEGYMKINEFFLFCGEDELGRIIVPSIPRMLLGYIETVTGS